jgi:hypothetical protein
MFDHSPGWNPQKNLWQAVLLRAIEDALRPTMMGSAGFDRDKAIQEARDYLTKPSRDLSMVCNLAGLDMQAVIDRMKVQIAKG